jgi:transcriptional activator SPT7
MENPEASLKKKRRRRKKQAAKAPDASADVASPNSLLSLMNTNIKCMRRVRRTHAKFAELANTNEDGAGGGAVTERASSVPLAGPSTEVEEVLDERPWSAMRPRGEMREELAEDCLHWTGKKMLEHAGFQGQSCRHSPENLSPFLWKFLFELNRFS